MEEFEEKRIYEILSLKENFKKDYCKTKIEKFYSGWGVNFKFSMNDKEFMEIFSTILYPKLISRPDVDNIDGEIILRKNKERIKLSPKGEKIYTYFTPLGVFKFYKCGDYFVILKGKYSAMIGRLKSKKIWLFVGERDVFTNFVYSALIILYKNKKFFALHSALIKRGKNVVLVSGKSNSGKTTIAVNLVITCRGFSYICDDICFLHDENGLIKTHGFCKKLKIALFDLAEKNKLILYRTKNRRALDLKQGCLNLSYQPTVLIFPRIVVSKKSSLLSISKEESLKKLMSFSPFLWIESGSILVAHIDILKKLVNQVRCYELRAGRDIKNTPSKLYELFKKAAIF